jgi:hypothetical protein
VPFHNAYIDWETLFQRLGHLPRRPPEIAFQMNKHKMLQEEWGVKCNGNPELV